MLYDGFGLYHVTLLVMRHLADEDEELLIRWAFPVFADNLFPVLMCVSLAIFRLPIKPF